MTHFAKLRAMLGLTQQALADRLGCTQGNVSFYEKGQMVPPNVAAKLIGVAQDLGHELSFNDVYAPLMPRRRTRKAIAA